MPAVIDGVTHLATLRTSKSSGVGSLEPVAARLSAAGLLRGHGVVVEARLAPGFLVLPLEGSRGLAVLVVGVAAAVLLMTSAGRVLDLLAIPGFSLKLSDDVIVEQNALRGT